MERLSLSDKQQVKLGLSLGFLASITLIGYEVARSASYTLFKFDYGTENLPIVMTFIPLAAIASLFIYDLMLNKWGPKWTLMLSTLISAVTFFLCYIGLLFKVKLASGVLFVFREIYIVILIEQYWSYINSGITKEMARQLNGPLIGISTLGSMVGGLLLGFATKSLGTLNMLLIPILLCIPAFFISHIIYKKFGEPMAQKKPHNFFKVTGLKSLFSNKRLSFLFFVIVFTQLVATVLDLAFQSRVQEAFPQLDEQTSKLGFFYGTLNGVALFFQFILTPFLLRYVKPVTAFLFIPIVNLVLCSWSLVDMSIYSIGLALLMFKALDYSLFRATKETFYIPLSFDERYRTKEIIDVFAYRTSKGMTSLSITLLKSFVRFSDLLYTGIATIGVGCWLFFAYKIKSENAEN